MTTLSIAVLLVVLAGLVPVLVWSWLLRGPGLAFSLFVAVPLFALAFLVPAWPWLSGAVTIPWDAKAQFQPQLAFLAQSLARGESPFWAPYVFAGWPQIADPQSLIFSPLYAALAFVDAAPGFRAADGAAFAMLFLGGTGIVLLFRDRGWHLGGALVAALSFAFGGAAASRIQHIGEVVSLSFLMLALWLLSRALARSSWRAGVTAGVAAALMAIGRDQVALLGLYILAGFVIAHVVDGAGRAPRLRASVTPLVAAALAGLAVVAVPVVMSALLAADSNRPVIDYISAGRGSLHPAHLLTLFVPDLYGAADPAVPYWGPPSFPWGVTDLFLAQNMGQLYLGALPLIAIVVFGLARGMLWSREIRAFTVLTALVLLYALGWYTPAFRAMYELLPGVSLFRRPADAAFPLGALLAILGGYLVHRWLSDTMPRASNAQRAVAAGIGLAAIAAAAAVAMNVGMTNVAVPPIVVAVAWLAGGVIALVVARRFGTAKPLVAAVIVTTFAAADLAWNNAPNESTGLPPAMYDVLRPDTRNETIALLKAKLAATAGPDRRDRVELTGIGYHWPNAGLVHRLDSLFGHNPLRLADFAAATGVGDTVAVPDQRKFAPLFPSYRSTVADLFGLRFIATGVPVEQVDPSLKPGDLALVAHTPDAYVYENPRAFPRAMLVTDWRKADFKQLIRNGWPDVDPRHIVLLERGPPVPPVPIAQNGGEGSVRIATYKNTDVVLDVNAPDGGLVVLNDAWHPWWRAEVDGTPAEILKANVLFRAVAVPSGRHVVRFRFRPFEGAWDQLRETFAGPR